MNCIFYTVKEHEDGLRDTYEHENEQEISFVFKQLREHCFCYRGTVIILTKKD